MEVNGQLHDSVTVEQEAEWARDPDRAFWGTDKPLAPPKFEPRPS
jgi:hypothetical protein